MNLTLHVWRQKNKSAVGGFATYQAKDISPDSSFLEMLDVVNEELTAKGEEPIAFDHDCREGICGACGMVINGRPHGPRVRTTTFGAVMPKRRRNFLIFKETAGDGMEPPYHQSQIGSTHCAFHLRIVRRASAGSVGTSCGASAGVHQPTRPATNDSDFGNAMLSARSDDTPRQTKKAAKQAASGIAMRISASKTACGDEPCGSLPSCARLRGHHG